MYKDSKTVGSLKYDPIDSLKKESIERMKTALLASSLDDPTSAAFAIRSVTIMRVYHQVARIVQYLDLMDKLESAIYEKVEEELNTVVDDDSNFYQLTKLLAVQEKLQKSIIESNKLLAPYLEMDNYPAFESIESVTPVSASVLEVSSTQRNLLRENAGSILDDLKSLAAPDSSTVSIDS